MSTIEHISQFLIQYREAAGINALRIHLFALSLFGSAFAWFSSLQANSITTWADLEKQFHKYFFAGVHDMRLIDLISVKQRNDELVTDYIQRFRDTRSRCFSLSVSDSQLAELAFQGLLPHIKERLSSQEFDSLSHLAQRLASVNVRALIPGRTLPQKRINFIGDSSDSNEEGEIGLAKCTKKREPVLCSFAKNEREKYGLDITKDDRIFNLLLQEGQIKLSVNHTIPSAAELKNHRFCKWHNSFSHLLL